MHIVINIIKQYRNLFNWFLKNKNAAARIHFDLAHELGHILLHDWNEGLSEVKEEFKELENQANDFAAAFLMPENEFRADIGNYANKLPYYVELKKGGRCQLRR